MKSKIQRISVVRGSSLNPSYVFSIPSFPDISDVNWTGKYVIRKGGLSGANVFDDNLGKSSDGSKFVFAMNPSDTALLEEGNYFLSIQIKNETLSPPISLEIVQCPFIVEESGVV